MKAEKMRSMIEAHGWIGLFMSIPLFIIFWAGAITFFQPEIYRWANMPHYPIKQYSDHLDLNRVIENSIALYHADVTQRIGISFPNERSPYYRLSLAVPRLDEEPSKAGENSDNSKSELKQLKLDPGSGEVLDDSNLFEIADFFYQLHYNLKLPLGNYIVGFITLFFLILVFSGIVIQLRKIISHFFIYRKDKTLRYAMNDLHNVVGVISLPYTFLFAVTGLMLNLSLIAQVPTVLVLYNGDLDAVLLDAGAVRVKTKSLNQPLEMPDLNELVANTEKLYGIKISTLNINNYGDKNAVIRLRGAYQDSFNDRVERYYKVDTGDFPSELNPPLGNAFIAGTRLLYRIHFANLGGIDLRLIFFLIAMGVCAMIIAGNILWIAKRQKRSSHQRVLRLIRSLTLGGCAGILPATAFTFLLERVLSEDWTFRVSIVQTGFFISLFIAVLFAFCTTKNRTFVAHCISITSILFAITFFADWLIFKENLLVLWKEGYPEPIIVNVSFAVFAAVFLGLNKAFQNKRIKEIPDANQMA